MNEKEAMDQVTSTVKFYVGIIPQSTASNFLKRYRQGKTKQSTVVNFLKKFGYIVDQKITYRKID